MSQPHVIREVKAASYSASKATHGTTVFIEYQGLKEVEPLHGAYQTLLFKDQNGWVKIGY